MANVKIIFTGSKKSDTENHELQTYANTNGEIYISINDCYYPESFICLDKQTAVRLVRELKKQIGYL